MTTLFKCLDDVAGVTWGDVVIVAGAVISVVVAIVCMVLAVVDAWPR